MRLVLLLDAAQDLDGVLDRRLADEDLLEAALQGRVLLDPLAELVEGRRADHVQLTARQHRLEHVAGVHGRVAAGARADDRVQLVDEGDDPALGVLDLLEHGLEPLLELAAVLRPGDHRRQVEREHPASLEGVGHVAGDHALGQALDDGGLADAGLADEDRVVLRPPAQHLHDPADLGVATDDGVEPALLGCGGEVDGVLLERLVGRLGVLAGHPARATDGGERLPEAGLGEADVGEHLLRAGLGAGHRDEQVLGGDVVVLEGGGEVEGTGEHAGEGRGGGRLLHRRARGARQHLQRRAGTGHQRGGVDPGLGHQGPGHAVLLREQRDEQVDRLGGRVARLGGRQLGGLDGLPAAGRELVGAELAHGVSSCDLGDGPSLAVTCTNAPGLESVPLKLSELR